MAYKVIIGLPAWQTIGPAVRAERLVRGLLQHGHDARILLTEGGCSRIDTARNIQTPPHDLPCVRLASGPNDTLGQRWEAIERYLEEQAPCFYLMDNDWHNNIIASRLSRRIKLVGLVQAGSDLEIKQAMHLGQFWDAIVAVSEPIHFKLCTRLPHLAPRIITIHNGVPSTDVMPSKSFDGPLKIAYSGELNLEQARLEDMLDIANQLDMRGTRFQLTLFGDGPHRAHLEAKYRHLIEGGTVLFKGILDSAALLAELNSQHVFLLTSECDGPSIAMLEAMSRGCVPVAPRLTSQSYLVRDNEIGLTAQVGDIAGFAAQLNRLDTDRELLANLAGRAFTIINEETYRLSDMVASYISLFEQIDSGNKNRRFMRARLPASMPSQGIVGTDILQCQLDSDTAYIDEITLWPDPPQISRRAQKRNSAKSISHNTDYRVIVSCKPDAISGVDIFARLLVQGLLSRGIDARLDCPSLLRDECFDDGAYNLPIEERDPALESNHLGWPQRWRRKAAQLNGLAPCIYIPNYDDDYSCISPLLSPGVNVIGIAHSDDPWHYEHLCRIGHACDAIVGVSSAISEHISKLVPEWSERLHTIPYGIKLPDRSRDRESCSHDLAHQNSLPLRIIYAGRLVCRQKRAADLITIARELHSRNVNFELAIVGDGELRSQLERSALDLIRDRILWFTGSQPNSGVFELLERADVFLLPSAFEGLSVSLLEAMARGVVPVVSSLRSGIPDLIRPGENGLIVPVGDYSAFADCLEWLWKNPVERARLSKVASSTVCHQYHLDQMVDRYSDLFQSILSEPLMRPIGPPVPPAYRRHELYWSTWAWRVLSDPTASVQRVWGRFIRPSL